MGKILCATRGGEESIQTQSYAIKRAQESGDELIFIYIFDLDFLIHAATGRHEVIEEEMINMAEFLMTMAVERAEKAGVESRYLIRRGRLATELAAAAVEVEATVVILGRPAEQSLFRMSGLETLIESLSDKTGIAFILRPEAD